MEVTVTYDLEIEADRQAYKRSIEGTELVDDDMKTQKDDKQLSMPSEEHELVYEAVQANPGHALRVYHRTLVEDDEAPYDDYDGWNRERKDIRSKLWELEERGHVRNDGQTWYTVGTEE